MDDVTVLRLRLADLTQLRDGHAAGGKHHLVVYLEQLIAETEARIALAELPQDPKPRAS